MAAATPVPADLKDALRFMLDELEGNCLEVAKLRVGRDGCYLRVVLSENADWYKAFCAAHQTSGRGSKAGQWHNRRHGKLVLPTQARNWSHRQYSKPNDTVIKRRNIINALRTMIAKGVSRSPYAEDLFEAARMYDEQWREQEEYESAEIPVYDIPQPERVGQQIDDDDEVPF